jgi:hypothetical protein
MINQFLKDTARDAVIGKKYAAHVIYSTETCSAVVDTYSSNPQTDWLSAIETAESRVAAWIDGTNGVIDKILDSTEHSCNLFAITIMVRSDDDFAAIYVVDLVELN